MSVTSDKSLQTGRDTYRYLRGGMVVIIVLLFAAVLINSIPTDCWQGSISAYYYTAARNVFAAALCCLGIMLIVYKGSNDTEDVLLNLAGTLAFFVAFVPAKMPEPGGCQLILPTADEKLSAINNNVGATIVALIVAAAILAFVYVVDKQSHSDTTQWGNRLRILSAVILACFVAAFFFAPKLFEATAHYAAAIIIFTIIVAVVFINAYLVSNQDEQDPKTRERYRNCYRFIGWMMLGSLLGAVAFATMGWLSQRDAWSIPVFALETILLIEFALFWAFQTVELWNHTDRNTLITPDMQATLAPL